MTKNNVGSRDTQCRKYQITINNPTEKGLTHDAISAILQNMKSTKYYCMADEQGLKEATLHTHIFVCFSVPVRFSTLRNAFNELAHIEPAKGTSQQNRDYILKQGKYETKSETSIEGTFEEFGTMPIERQGHRTDLAVLYEQIKDGYTDYELVEANPDNMRFLNHAERVRQSIKYEKIKNVFRKLDVTYIFGATATGKTRYVMEKFGYENVYRITDYSNPFDFYGGNAVVCFDEFSSQLTIQSMLEMLDGYPQQLKCRYHNKWAEYDTVYIISNNSLDKQYPNVQEDKPETWYAFLRRINHVYEFLGDGKTLEYDAYDFANGFPEQKRQKLLRGEQVKLNDLLTEIYDDNSPF